MYYQNIHSLAQDLKIYDLNNIKVKIIIPTSNIINSMVAILLKASYDEIKDSIAIMNKINSTFLSE